jgi:hypothetical protein
MRSLRSLSWMLCTLGLAAAAGCSSVPPAPPGATPDASTVGNDTATGAPDTAAAPDGTGQTQSGLTYYKDIQPLTQKHCQGCHTPGGIGPFPLTSYQEVTAQIDRMVAATQAGIMPPWQPSDDCRPLQGETRLDPSLVQMLADWKNAGMPEGNPADAPPPYVPPTMPPPDLTVAMPGRYLPKQDQTDDYHCFVLDPQLTEDKHVTGFIANPGNKAIVHHVLLFLAGPDHVAQVDQLDAAEPGPGYTCFGDAGFSPSNATESLILGAWAPGSPPTILPEGIGIRVPAGSKLVLQVHYNVPNAPGTDDLTKVDLYFAPQGAVLMDAIALPFAPFNPQTGEPSLHIPAGDAHATVEAAYPIPADFRIYGTGGHMHLRGKTFNLKIQRQTGEHECLLTLPHWDFHWQGGYQFMEPIDFHSGDTLIQTCTYDNSAAGQPLGADGKPLPVTDINWGEKTTDEMCLSFSIVTQIPQ